MAKFWECCYCGERVSDLGQYAKLGGAKYAHIACQTEQIEAAFTRRRNQEAQEADEAAREAQRAREDAKAKMAQDAESAVRAELLGLRTKGKALWTPDERKQLVAAKMICVHCGCNLRPSGSDLDGVAPAGPSRMHCSPCYMAREYGEAQAAQGAAKSAEGIANVSQTLAGSAPAKPPEPSKPQSDQPVKDRFQLIEVE